MILVIIKFSISPLFSIKKSPELGFGYNEKDGLLYCSIPVIGR